MKYFKNTILSILLLAIGGAAFRLSFDAQVTLATASGLDPTLAWLYPGVVDTAILAGVLIGIWNPHLHRSLAGYVWTAIAFWTTTSILGNAFHVIALPDTRITVPVWLAIAVNTVPALTLFLAIHLATTTAFRKAPTPAIATKKPRRAPKDFTLDPIGEDRPTPTVRAPRAPRSDIPEPTDTELLALADAGLSMAQIGERIGRSKSYAGARVKNARDNREKAA